MTIKPFETLDRLRARMAEALIAQSGLTHPALTRHLRKVFVDPDPAKGGLIRPPVLEGAFPFETHDASFGALAPDVLGERTVEALSDGSAGDLAFPRDRKPYRHQVAAWKALTARERRSVLVTAGTGSGKTECFLVPIIDDLMRYNETVEGVEAIVLYPLNALIASQRERLDAWTRPAGGKVRYCLYNGDLKPDVSAAERRANLTNEPQCVNNRPMLRESPPPILVTNLTMLEYMLVRPQDAPILEKSRGKLKWIVLDEAHTLIGAAAAEVSLLLRRVMEAFEVTPDAVRFVATSATIGAGTEVEEELRKFLADVGGISASQVDVITGQRRLPVRPSKPVGGSQPPLCEERDAAQLYDRLGSMDDVWSLVKKLGEKPVPTTEFEKIGRPLGMDGPTLAMRLTQAVASNGDVLAPLRVHSFHRAVPGLWSCLNAECSGKPDADWPAGRIFHERIERCLDCRNPVGEIVGCYDCGTAFALAEEKDRRLQPPTNKPPSDEFQFEAQRDIEEADEDEAVPEQAARDLPSVRHCLSLDGKAPYAIFIERQTGKVFDDDGEGRYRLACYGDGKGACPACGSEPRTGDRLRPFRFGAPFIIGNAAPILLAAMPAEKHVRVSDKSFAVPDLPSDGRQLISFTDSRQGTARMAAKLQNEAERAFVRSIIYQNVQRVRQEGGGELSAEDREKLTAYKSIPDWKETALRGLVEEIEKKAAGAALPTVGWTAMRSILAERPEVRDWLADVWGDRADIFRSDGASPASTLANALLLRELMRRPRSANSVETLGLARLVCPEIEKLVDGQVPASFKSWKGTLKDWKAWLCAVLNFSVRSAVAVRASSDTVRWMMRSAFVKALAAPGLQPGRGEQAWLRPNSRGSQSQAIALLATGLGLDLEDPEARHVVSEWCEKAWHQLLPAFPADENNRRALNFDRMGIAPVEKAFLCPVTRRFVETAPFGLSPYAKTADDKAEPIDMPAMPADASSRERAEWLAADERVARLRARGLWTDVHDRIALFAPYARSAEHSAQLEPARLRGYETKFKAGLINLLNCSTTMEMGVDIGSVNGVLMTNVPPSIANYRQRVGRAGRRGQPLSLAFTFAKDRPMDREAFRDPAKFLNRSVAAPRVALDSAPIVQRHVNAFLLALFLKQRFGNLLKLRSGEFFGYPADLTAARKVQGERPSAAFADWLASGSTRMETKNALARLVRASVLAGRSDLLSTCREMLTEAEEAFGREWNALRGQLRGAGEEVAAKAIELQLRRLCDEYLLGDLADRGFLPGHGFPNHVVTFELDRQMNRDGSPNEMRGRRHGGPKRPLDIAIRDYAPGSETVVDGQVYRVGGVTLNWQRPSGDEAAREIQALRYSARCRQCGDSWTGQGGFPESCRTCGDGPVESASYLKPAGFLRDRHTAVHADTDMVDYIEPEEALVSASGARWEVLGAPETGRFRISRVGSVYFHTRGPSREGYGLCLRCGRMEPMKPGETICTALNDHKPLRSRENFTEPCIGNTQTFAIRHGIHLGHEIHTDVLEIQPAAMPSEAAANALAIALREAIAQHLGVEADEVGFAIAPSRNAMANTTRSIQLFDRPAGGAGYVSRAADDLRKIVRDARGILDCPEKCKLACPSCVLSADGPDEEERLSRHDAIAFLDAHMALPDSLAHEDRFVPGADLSVRPLVEIDIGLQSGIAPALTLWTRCDDIVDLSDWAVTDMLRRWTDNGRAVTLALAPGTIATLDDAQRLFLRDYAVRHGLALAEGDAPRFGNGAVLFATVKAGNGNTGWASRSAAVLVPHREWAERVDAPIARGPLEEQAPALEPVDLSALQPRPEAVVNTLGAAFDGPIADADARFAKAVTAAARRLGFDLSRTPERIVYSDRYARSPIVLRLLIDTVAGLADENFRKLLVRTSSGRPSNSYRTFVWTDLDDDIALSDFAAAYGDRRNLDVSLSIESLPHKRSLTFEYADRSALVIDFDQGFGWLDYRGHDRMVDTSMSPQALARSIAGLTGRVERRHSLDSQMVVWRR